MKAIIYYAPLLALGLLATSSNADNAPASLSVGSVLTLNGTWVEAGREDFTIEDTWTILTPTEFQLTTQEGSNLAGTYSYTPTGADTGRLDYSLADNGAGAVYEETGSVEFNFASIDEGTFEIAATYQVMFPVDPPIDGMFTVAGTFVFVPGDDSGDPTAPESLPIGAEFALAGTWNDSGAGEIPIDETWEILSATELQIRGEEGWFLNATYSYTRTEPNNGTISYSISNDEGGSLYEEVGMITFTFASTGAGVFTSSGSYDITGAPDPPITGTFAANGTFVYNPGTSVERPMLTIVRAIDGSTTVSWTSESLGFLLQESSELGSNDWTDVSGVTGKSLLIPSSEPTRFYRLKKL